MALFILLLSCTYLFNYLSLHGSLFLLFTGKATDPDSVNQLRKAFMLGSGIELFINLNRDDGVVLCSHVHLHIIGFNDGIDSNDQSQPLKYGVLTIRSASSVGNAKFCHVGLTHLDSFPLEARLRALNCCIEDF